jgi:hypothetical protein
VDRFRKFPPKRPAYRDGRNDFGVFLDLVAAPNYV